MPTIYHEDDRFAPRALGCTYGTQVLVWTQGVVTHRHRADKTCPSEPCGQKLIVDVSDFEWGLYIRDLQSELFAVARSTTLLKIGMHSLSRSLIMSFLNLLHVESAWYHKTVATTVGNTSTEWNFADTLMRRATHRAAC